MFLTFETMIGCSKETERFVQIVLIVAAPVLSSELNAAPVKVANHAGGGCNATIFRGNICLKTSSFVDNKLPALVNRRTEAWVVLSGVDVVGIILGVVDVLLRTTSLLARSIRLNIKCHTGNSRVSLW